MSKRNSPESKKIGKLPYLRHGRHCVTLMHVHLVFVTKYRRQVFSERALSDLKKIFSDVCLKFESTLVEFNGESEHVHLLIEYPPKISISKLVNSLKGVSARLLRQKKYPEISRKLWGAHLWSPSYFAGSCGGTPLEIVKQYIERQQTGPLVSST